MLSGRFIRRETNRQRASILNARTHSPLMSLPPFVNRSYIALGKGDVGKVSDDVIPLQEIDQVCLRAWTRNRAGERGEWKGRCPRKETDRNRDITHTS